MVASANVDWPAEGRLRLVGIPETNKVMAGELSRLSRRALKRRPADPRKEGTGQLVYPFDPELARLAVAYQRTCARVLWDLFASRAQRLEPLFDDIRAQVTADNRDWAWDGAGVSLRARNVSSFAASRGQVLGTVKNAVIEGAAARGWRLRLHEEHPDVLLAVRMHDDVVTVSVDLAGGAMHQRGYRTEAGEAPLREHLAAVILMLARWDPRREVLFDPMAGAGTLVIEGALMARGAPIWPASRQPSLVQLPLWRGKNLEPQDVGIDLFADTRPVVLANELDAETAAMSVRSAERAGAADQFTVRRGDFRDLTPDDILDRAAERSPDGVRPQTGLIVCNPPYGKRVGGQDVKRLYGEMAQWLRGFRGWRAAFLVANRDFEPAMGRKPRVRKPLSNGPLRGYFVLYEL